MTTSKHPPAYYIHEEQMTLPIPELEQSLTNEEHLIRSLKNVLSLAKDHCDQLYPRGTPYVTGEGIIARESIERVETIVKNYTA